ncbi:hypothetical protein M427DRAFT_44284 [Gonapodya prolifera JEL478]|uniref:Uncharacterized protein n=1 Tax=Gonapodya prolifera (strain JEL478) TaxID=1344416 RepID=A0A139AFS5_GONPJ|nr:hypothetical protein M427DRAFT_44284 [Gonapodya prolifera JEL478]|eukprot:KXS15672.1 hypothetical protein M427DRAFT_44284 [Gonapodya prolifera JEL478]
MADPTQHKMVIDTSVEAKPEHVDELVAGLRSGNVRVSSKESEDPERQRAQKLAEVAEAAREGRLPTTAQAVQFLNRVESDKTLKEQTEHMGPEGKKVVSDVTNIAESTKRLLVEANPDDQLQKLIFYTSRAVQSISESTNRQEFPSEARKEASKSMDDLKKSVEGAANIARLLATSKEFRDISTDVLNLVIETWVYGGPVSRELVKADFRIRHDRLESQGGDTGKAIANATQQGVEMLQDEGKQQDVKDRAERARSKAVEGLNEGRQALFQPGDKSLKSRIQEASSQARKRTSDTTKSGQHAVPERLSGKKHKSSGHGATRATDDITGKIQDEGTQRRVTDKVKEEASEFREDLLAAGRGEKTLDDVVQSAKKQTGDVMDVVQSELPESVKGKDAQQVAGQLVDQANAVVEKAKSDLSNIEIPRERLEELARKWKELLVNGIGQREDFKRAWSDLGELVVSAAGKLRIAFDALSSTAKETTVEAQKDSRKALQAAKELVENFADHPLDRLVALTKELSDAIPNDPDLGDVLSDTNKVISRSHEQIIVQGKTSEIDEFTNNLMDLTSRARSVLLSKYEEPVTSLLGEVQAVLENLSASRSSAAMSKLGSDLETLARDMFLDDSGQPTLKPQLLRDLSKLVPLIAENLAYLPLPRIEQDDADVHYIFDNVVLKSTNILPSFVKMKTETTIDTDKPEGQRTKSVFDITISKIQSSARDIVFYYNKKSGLITMSDVGLLDFDIVSRDGMTVHIVLEPQPLTALTGLNTRADETEGEILRLVKSEVKIDAVDMRFHDTRHDTLYTVVKPVTSTYLRRKVEDALNGAIADTIMSLDKRITNEAKRRAREAREAAMRSLVTESSGKELSKDAPPEWGSKAYNVGAAPMAE